MQQHRMSPVTIVAVILVGAVLTITAETYKTDFDNIEPMSILGDETMRLAHYTCFMEDTPCPTPATEYFKEILPEAFVTNCMKCNDVQKKHMEELTVWYMENQPKQWIAAAKKAVNDFEKQYA